MEEIRIRIDDDLIRDVIFNSIYENFDVNKKILIKDKYIIYQFQKNKNSRALINSYLKSIFFMYDCLVVLNERFQNE